MASYGLVDAVCSAELASPTLSTSIAFQLEPVGHRHHETGFVLDEQQAMSGHGAHGWTAARTLLVTLVDASGSAAGRVMAKALPPPARVTDGDASAVGGHDSFDQ